MRGAGDEYIRCSYHKIFSLVKSGCDRRFNFHSRTAPSMMIWKPIVKTMIVFLDVGVLVFLLLYGINWFNNSFIMFLTLDRINVLAFLTNICKLNEVGLYK